MIDSGGSSYIQNLLHGNINCIAIFNNFENPLDELEEHFIRQLRLISNQ